ncbi:MAG: crossover junction endodeoxyribonuclease RuvC [Chloroherpetonaceae bacterium]|nr:crossover junction endodeoxyribonuclease RuvC [Chloroherpetonaceae bacterium]
MVILGVDPGTLITGYGIIEIQSGNFHTLDFGIIRTTTSETMPKRIKSIYDALERLISVHKPKRFAIETAFYGKNIQSTLKLGQVRGALMVLSAIRNLEYNEYAPRVIKQSVTGKGNASKEQVEFMIKKILNLSDTGKWKDASDALGIALCDSFRMKPNLYQENSIDSNGGETGALSFLLKQKKEKPNRGSSWKNYALSNPEKVIR